MEKTDKAFCGEAFKTAGQSGFSAVYAERREVYSEEKILPLILKIAKDSGLAGRIGPDKKILIKPNMLSGRNPSRAVTTHPEFVGAVILALKELGAKSENITLADSSGGPENSIVLQSNYNACGFSALAKKHNINLYVKQETTLVKTDGAMVKEFELIRPRRESDVIISLAKFKTHVMTGMSGAVKNLFGTVPGLKKAEFHMRFPDREKFARMLVDLCLAVKPDFTFVDGILAMEGDGPAGGQPRNLNLVLAGDNPFAIDLAMAKIMGFDPYDLPLVKAARERGLCPGRDNLSFLFREDGAEPEAGDILLKGEKELFRTIPDFKKPRSYSVDFSDHVPRPLRWATPAVERFLAPKPKIDKSKCVGCGKCAGICPRHTITITGKKASIDPKNCIRCFCCHEMCPVKAIDVKRSPIFRI